MLQSVAGHNYALFTQYSFCISVSLVFGDELLYLVLSLVACGRRLPLSGV